MGENNVKGAQCVEFAATIPPKTSSKIKTGATPFSRATARPIWLLGGLNVPARTREWGAS